MAIDAQGAGPPQHPRRHSQVVRLALLQFPRFPIAAVAEALYPDTRSQTLYTPSGKWRSNYRTRVVTRVILKDYFNKCLEQKTETDEELTNNDEGMSFDDWRRIADESSVETIDPDDFL